MKDLYNNIVCDQVIAPVLVLDATAPAAVEIDLVNFDSAVLEFCIGLKSVDTGTVTFTLTHADDDGDGAADSYANVEAKDMLGVTPSSGLILTVDVDGDADVETSMNKQFGYVGGKRFLTLTPAEVGDNANGVIMAVNVIKGHGLDKPAIA